MNNVRWIVSDRNVVVNYDGQTHIVARTDALADRLITALKDRKFDEIPRLVSVAKRIETASEGKFVVRDGEILVNGVAAPAYLGNKIVRFSNEGLPYEPLVRFAANLQKNPSFRAVNELFQFLEKNDHPITENGNFIAYKRVRPDFKDIRTATMDNSVGTIVEMPRNQVNEDSTQTCSAGLHVANWDYAYNHFGNSQTDVMLEVEVNPSDVVSIPVDYNQSKMRVCKYKVLAVVDQENSEVALRVTGSDEGWQPEETQCHDPDCGCEDDEEEETSTCADCGCDLTNDLSDLCEDCDQEEEETEDRYPYDDELDY